MIVKSTGESRADVDWSELKREALRATLERHVDGEIRFDGGSRAIYSTDASIYQIRPLGVAVPRTVDALATTVAIALEQQVPIIPRGGGTSLSGQPIGAGLVIDCSKYLDRVVDLDLEGQSVRVQPGCVLGQLNRRLKPLGFQFGPDVATIDRANIGGMIGNNSAGARSIRYGRTVDNVRSLDVVLSDGSRTRFDACDAITLQRKLAQLSREGDIYRAVYSLTRDNAAEIDRRFPKVFRRVSGYNLDAMLPPADFNLAKLIVGSEGTLATVTEATLSIIPLSTERGIALIEFNSVADAMKTLVPILATNPSAVELIDELVLDLARRSPEYRKYLDFLVGAPEAIFIVEYLSDDPTEIDRSFAELREAIAGHRLEHVTFTTDTAQCERIWSIRKTALPLLLSLPGSQKPQTFVEDTAVAPERLGEFVERFREILTRHGTDGSFYGHASVGCLHIRPLLDLESPEGIGKMKQIADEVLALVMEFGGSMSGEHGDGLARSCFNPILFGDKIYSIFREVKEVFDPLRLFNPGKIVDAPPMTENLRYGTTPLPPTSQGFEYESPMGPLAIVRECNGNGLCRRQQAGVMCPSFMATHEEQHNPRGRANLLRAALEGRLPLPDGVTNPWSAPELGDALDLCLGCKACKTECPSSVDIAKIKSEYLYHRHKEKRPSLLDRMMARLPVLGQWGSRFAPFSNVVMRNWLVRRWLYPAMGIDPRRRLPVFRRNTLVDWFKQHRCIGKEIHGQVVLLADCFTNWNDPHVGRAAVILLELAGYQVHLAPICCGRTLISKGFLDEARTLVEQGVRRLSVYAEEGIPILGLEPSCILTLADEWLDLYPGESTSEIASRVSMVDGWLAEQVAAGKALLPQCELEPMEVLVHGHCHQKSAERFEGTLKALRELAGLVPKVIDSGCCGMAGSFGYETGHFEVSVDVAEQRLLPAIREAPHTTVIAPGFSCRCQIRDLSGRVALHPIEIIRRRVGVNVPKRMLLGTGRGSNE